MMVTAILAILVWNARELVKECAGEIAVRIVMMTCALYLDKRLRADRSAQLLADLADLPGPMTKLNVAAIWAVMFIAPSAVASNIRMATECFKTHRMASVMSLAIVTFFILLIAAV